MKYVIESEHEPEECMKAMKEMAEAQRKEVLDKFVWACKSGEHVAWAYVDADSKEAALDNVPEFIRDKACVHEVTKLTEEDIKAMH